MVKENDCWVDCKDDCCKHYNHMNQHNHMAFVVVVEFVVAAAAAEVVATAEVDDGADVDLVQYVDSFYNYL